MSLNKEEKLDLINIELAKLNNQITSFNKLLNTSNNQFSMIKNFGIQQSTFLSSSHNVFQTLNQQKEELNDNNNNHNNNDNSK